MWKTTAASPSRDVVSVAGTESLWTPASVIMLLGAPGTLIIAWTILLAARW